MTPHIAKLRDYSPFVNSVEAHTSYGMRYRDIAPSAAMSFPTRPTPPSILSVWCSPIA
jgi:hypothetical protein